MGSCVLGVPCEFGILARMGVSQVLPIFPSRGDLAVVSAVSSLNDLRAGKGVLAEQASVRCSRELS